jgi:hypothetical protein
MRIFHAAPQSMRQEFGQLYGIVDVTPTAWDRIDMWSIE